jgi:hypothetical protein
VAPEAYVDYSIRLLRTMPGGTLRNMKYLPALMRLALVSIVALCFGMTWGQAKKTTKTDAEVKQAIIVESIASYRGSCPCPYNTDRAGRRCGGRSAYSRPGGASPICYEKDVTQKMVDDYRERTEK